MNHMNFAQVALGPADSVWDSEQSSPIDLKHFDFLLEEDMNISNAKHAERYFSPMTEQAGKDLSVGEGGQPSWRNLYLVSFKSSRSDIFILDEHMKTEPNPGDMVIVDGDRGKRRV